MEYRSRHIPMPLGEVFGQDIQGHSMPIGILSEHVFGVETSYNAANHTDFATVDSAFKRFGLMNLTHDLYSGFQGEENSQDHNFFCQNYLYPEEHEDKEKNTNTSRWMRIDFEPTSFPFDKETFIAACVAEKEKMHKAFIAHGNLDELYFLTEYCKILNNKPIEDKNKFESCIQRIRQKNLKIVIATQTDLCKRSQEPYSLDQRKNELTEHIQNQIDSETKKITAQNEDRERFNKEIIKYKMNRDPKQLIPDFPFHYLAEDKTKEDHLEQSHSPSPGKK